MMNIDRILRDHGIGVGLSKGEIQSGVTSFDTPTQPNYVDINISEIDLNKSFLLFTASPKSVGYDYSSEHFIGGYIINSTTVRFYRNYNSVNYNISWYVVTSDNIKKIQRGTIATTTKEKLVTISKVDLRKSFITSYHTSTANATSSMYSSTYSYLKNDTTLSLNVMLTSTANNFYWQVIEFK